MLDDLGEVSPPRPPSIVEERCAGESGHPQRFVPQSCHDVGEPRSRVDAHPVAAISPGDEVILTNHLLENGKMVGKLRTVCTATSPSGAKGENLFINAHFICEAVYNIGGSSLWANAELRKGGTRGVITGGTGKFANARGTVITTVEKAGETSVITLVE